MNRPPHCLRLLLGLVVGLSALLQPAPTLADPVTAPPLIESRDDAPSAPALPPRTSRSGSRDQTSARFPLQVPGGTWRTIGALAGVIGLILLLRSAMLRLGGSPLGRAKAPAGVVEVLGRFPLARGQTLLLLKVDRRILLVAQTPQGLSTLSEITDAEQVASLIGRIRNDRGDSFSRQFERLITPVRDEADAGEPSPTVIDLTRSRRVAAARRVASMLADGGRA
ncbi:MAG: flagellar biosynthetic protein FliO [Phycisphaerales bacterium]|nr:flagellar biosynthetic protein FliO [Phycisphaerales bacterium]